MEASVSGGAPLVSVIITTYHNEQYLGRAVESVLRQTYRPIELIVVDDNPPDSAERAAAEAVMAAYPDVRYLRHPQNLNGAAARNTGIRAANGEYLAFLDNDDIYFETHIADCAAALQAHPDCGAVLCGVVKICRGVVWDRIDVPEEDDMVRALLFSETALGTGSNLFLRTEAVRAIGGFDERFRRHQDVEFGLRYFAENRVCRLGDVQIVKEMDGYSNMPDFARFYDAKRLLWDSFAPLLSSLSEEESRRYYAGQYSALLYAACKSGDRSAIAQTAESLAQYRPLNRKERLLVNLSRMRMFGAYEGLKAAVKRSRSAALERQITAALSAQDLQVWERALLKRK